MTFSANKTALAAAVALTASVGLTLPAAADAYSGYHMTHHQVRATSKAYRMGYRRGFLDGHLAALEGPVTTGRSVYVDPAAPVVVQRNGGVFGNGGLLGLGIFGGDGVLGTGVLNGQGALGVGVLGL